MAKDPDSSSKDPLRIWTVYKNPIDYPNQYVARLFEYDKPTATAVISENYTTIEGFMLSMHLHRIPAAEDDEKQILEMWL